MPLPSSDSLERECYAFGLDTCTGYSVSLTFSSDRLAEDSSCVGIARSS